jgi:two-component system, NarL family, sensor histidine kinase UhpB
VWDDAKEKLLIVGGFCTLVLAMISGTLGRALRPLETLSNALQQVGGGDYGAHVPEKGPQELADIYKGFNTMAAKLADAEQRNQRLAEQLSTVQDEERAEIARDLHDEVGPFLFAVDVDAQTIPALLARDAKTDVSARAAAIRQSVAHMQTHVRSVLSRLRPGMLLDLGLSHAADQLATFWKERYPAIEFDVDCSEDSFGAKLDEAAFRVLQEATNNAVRHGRPTRISLSTRRQGNGALVVSVVDNGDGLVETARKGFGLAGMRDRIALLGGSLDISKGPDGKGVSIRAEIPVKEQHVVDAR